MFPLLKLLSCMALHMLSVSVIGCINEALENCTSKALLSASKNENMQVPLEILYPFASIHCSAGINHEPDGLSNGDIQS